jgi:hypothetical protein
MSFQGFTVCFQNSMSSNFINFNISIILENIENIGRYQKCIYIHRNSYFHTFADFCHIEISRVLHKNPFFEGVPFSQIINKTTTKFRKCYRNFNAWNPFVFGCQQQIQ